MKTLISESVAQLYFYYFVLIHIELFPILTYFPSRDYLLLLTPFSCDLYMGLEGVQRHFLQRCWGHRPTTVWSPAKWL